MITDVPHLYGIYFTTNSEIQSSTNDFVFRCRQSQLWRQPTNHEKQKQTKWIEIYQLQPTDVTF